MNNQPIKQMFQLRLEFQWNQALCIRPQQNQLKFCLQDHKDRIDKKLQNLRQGADKDKGVFLSPKMIYQMNLR